MCNSDVSVWCVKWMGFEDLREDILSDSLAGPSHSYQHDQQQVKLHVTRAVYGKALLQPKIQGE